MSLRRWLGLGDGPDVASGGLEEIERALEALDPERARHIACFAYILGRAARADHRVSQDEADVMTSIVAERTGIPAEQAALAVKLATAHGVRHGGTEDFLVTRAFASMADREERLALLDCLFVVSSAEGGIATLEDNEVRRIASELKLEHGDFIASRARFLQHLNVLRKRGDKDR